MKCYKIVISSVVILISMVFISTEIFAEQVKQSESATTIQKQYVSQSRMKRCPQYFVELAKSDMTSACYANLRIFEGFICRFSPPEDFCPRGMNPAVFVPNFYMCYGGDETDAAEGECLGGFTKEVSSSDSTTFLCRYEGLFCLDVSTAPMLLGEFDVCCIGPSILTPVPPRLPLATPLSPR
jgi:hypothetical protein